MPLLKNTLKILLLSLLIAVLPACQKSNDDKTLKVGTIAGPETELMTVAQQIAKEKYHLKVEIIQFTDYTMPNEALADGSVDANAFQHDPYLQEAIQKRGYKIVAAGKTFIYPMGIYSQKIKQLTDLKPGATVAIPNDPSNSARALLLLQSAGLITLKADVSALGTVADIVANPKNLKFKEIDASQLPRTLPDVDIAAINTNYAMVAGLLPSRDALFIEKTDSPYANLIVVRTDNATDERVKQLLEAFHSDEVVKKADELFKGQAVPAWK